MLSPHQFTAVYQRTQHTVNGRGGSLILMLLCCLAIYQPVAAQGYPTSLTVGQACLNTTYILTKAADDYNNTSRPAYQGTGNVTLNANTYPNIPIAIYYEPTRPAWVLTLNGQPYLSNTSNATLPPTTGWTALNDPAGLGSCTGVSPISLTLSDPPSVAISPTTPQNVCSGALVSLTAVTIGLSAPINYTWTSNPAGLSGSSNVLSQNAPTVAGLTTYTITLTASDGAASVTTTAAITVLPKPTVSINPSATVVCRGQNVSLAATTALSSYSWSNGQNTPIISVTDAGSYSLTATDANNCSNTATATVSSNTLVSLSVNSPLSCTTTSVTLTAAGGFTSYTFSTGASQQGGAVSNSAIVSLSGIYSVTALDNNTCQTVASVTVTGSSTPASISLLANAPISCTATNALLTATSGFLSYTFSNGASQQGGTSGQTATVTTAGVYSVTGLDANSCLSSGTATVSGSSVPTPVSISASGFLSCTNSTVTLNASSGFSSYTFSAGALQQGGTTGNSATVRLPGNYSVTATDANYCQSTNSVSVSSTGESSPISLTSSGVLTCAQPATLSATPGFNSYTFSVGNAQLSGVNGNTALASSPGVYTVAGTNSSGCISVTTLTVTGNINPPTASYLTSGTLASGQSVTIVAFGGVSYELIRSVDRINNYEIRQSELNTTGQFIVLTPGLYTVAVVGPNGCKTNLQIPIP